MNILITGSSNGIGYQTTLQLVQNKCVRILGLSRNEQKLRKLEKKCISIGGTGCFSYLKFDLESFEASTLLEKLKTIEFKSVDVLINNAGHLVNKPFAKLTEKDWQTTYDVNVFGTAKLIQTLLPSLLQSSKPHVVNIGSYGGFQGSTKFLGLSSYSSSKAALANLTECLAEEFKGKINFNCLALGAVQTDMLKAAFPDYKAPMTPEKMAEFIAWFAINGHHQFNGKILPVTTSTI